MSLSESEITSNPNHISTESDASIASAIMIDKIIRKKNVVNLRKIIKKNIKTDRAHNRKLKTERNNPI
ncbi:MAG: hypothetical protein Faunusvirus1_69 [Faunusvirus sp.]|jgi:hypothetical protein|uniref:Uncharacterized protein n=1 Tax=Faunusvirus sp. TaxID=2487766 RepID=A0A3G5A0F2_9VIRU|nr:MAG: hypothetical protein Faunusvirus1_69 [Faunusvirus sp.]